MDWLSSPWKIQFLYPSGARQGSHTRLPSKLPEFYPIFAWGTTEFLSCENSKFQNISASIIPLQPTTYTSVNQWNYFNWKLPKPWWNCMSFAWFKKKIKLPEDFRNCLNLQKKLICLNFTELLEPCLRVFGSTTRVTRVTPTTWTSLPNTKNQRKCCPS